MAPKSNSTGVTDESDTKVYDYDGDPLNRYPWAKHLAGTIDEPQAVKP